MYLDSVDQLTRDDIAAAAAVHSELGRDYDDAVAESLVERIGAEIDKRVDARLRERGQAPAPFPGQAPAPWAGQAPAPQPGQAPAPRLGAAAVFMGLGSMGMGLLASLVVLKGGGFGPGTPGQVLLVALIWIVIGFTNVVYARRN